MVARSTKLNVTVGGIGKPYQGIFMSYSELKIDATTNVRVEAIGRELRLYLNNQLDSVAFLAAPRVLGDSDSANPAPFTIVTSVYSISKFANKLHTTTSAISRFLTYNSTLIPQKFFISFDVTPKKTDGNILRCVSASGSLIVGTLFYSKAWLTLQDIKFLPGTTLLQYTVADSTENSWKKAIPLNQKTTFRLEVAGRKAKLFENDRFASELTFNTDVPFGPASFFVGYPGLTTAPATGSISPITISHISQLTPLCWPGDYTLDRTDVTNPICVPKCIDCFVLNPEKTRCVHVCPEGQTSYQDYYGTCYCHD